MPPRKGPPRRRSPDVVPDSLPKGGEEPDVLPDDLRRVDQAEVTPDSLPQHESPATDTRPDGGVEQHPTHDEDQEDKGPDDYEREVDAVASRGEGSR
jgi:hypothetical protein